MVKIVVGGNSDKFTEHIVYFFSPSNQEHRTMIGPHHGNLRAKKYFYRIRNSRNIINIIDHIELKPTVSHFEQFTSTLRPYNNLIASPNKYQTKQRRSPESEVIGQTSRSNKHGLK